jgi:hypothetical protein
MWPINVAVPQEFNDESLEPQIVLLCLRTWHTKELVDQSEKNEKKTCGTRITHLKDTNTKAHNQHNQIRNKIRKVDDA